MGVGNGELPGPGHSTVGTPQRAVAPPWWWPFSRRSGGNQPADGEQGHSDGAAATSPVKAREASPGEDRDYRTLIGPAWERDLPPADRRALLLEAYEAYLTNPLAHAVIELGTNFVLGGGVRVVADAPGCNG